MIRNDVASKPPPPVKEKNHTQNSSSAMNSAEEQEENEEDARRTSPPRTISFDQAVQISSVRKYMNYNYAERSLLEFQLLELRREWDERAAHAKNQYMRLEESRARIEQNLLLLQEIETDILQNRYTTIPPRQDELDILDYIPQNPEIIAPNHVQRKM